MQRGTFQLMKSVNKSLILNKIRTSEPISRAEIAKKTKLTPPTVSSIVRELIEQGIVIESDLGESSGGRKPTMLHINDTAFYVIGTDVGPHDIHSALTDLSGEIMYQITTPLTNDLTNKEFLDILKESIQTIIHQVVDQEKIIGIGVAMHGVVDVESGTSLIAPILRLKNVPLKKELEEAFGFEVKVENDARAMALGESWFGNHGDLDSMVTINLGHGVGAGAVINDRLYHGAQDLAGEVGHMTLDINGTICECGNRGCLQTFTSGPSIARRAMEKSKGSDVNYGTLTSEKVFELAKQGDQQMIEVLLETGRYLGIGLTNVIHTVNPALIIIGGGVSKAHEFILPETKKTIEQWALTPEAKQTKVTISSLGDNATLLGAISLLLVDLFSLT